MSERRKLFNYFTRQELAVGNVSFDDLFLIAIEKSLNKKGADRDKYYDANVKRIWNYVIKQQSDDQKNQSIQPIFHILNSITRDVQCYLKERFNYTGDNRFQLLQSRPFILNEIDLLNDRQYEALPILLCQLLGAKDVHLTPAGNEAGIDFIATMKYSDESDYLFGVNGPIRIIGQCKKYSTPVQVNTIKEFESTMIDVFHLTAKMRRILPTWFYEAKGVIVGWVISHSGFQQGAKDRGKEFGYVLTDSRDIAEIIAASQKFYPSIVHNQRQDNLKHDLLKILTLFK
ncbi:MAG TPA: restriction endonuclease [Mucilaginibacter sp.]|nr:restriction endonuclease [Mucilaginibacter sp.]